MIHLDFEWDVSPDGIILDEALNTDKLGWKGGDFFKFTNINGKQMLVKVDPLVPFLERLPVNGK